LNTIGNYSSKLNMVGMDSKSFESHQSAWNHW